MYVGRKQLFDATIFLQLCLCGVIGLTPYLYLFWAATHAPLGSWGDTSTLGGWPAVGFWTHFFRREYGTFSLYSGSKEKNNLAQSLSLYCVHAFKDTFGMVMLAPLGFASAGARNHGGAVVTL